MLERPHFKIPQVSGHSHRVIEIDREQSRTYRTSTCYPLQLGNKLDFSLLQAQRGLGGGAVTAAIVIGGTDVDLRGTHRSGPGHRSTRRVDYQPGRK